MSHLTWTPPARRLRVRYDMLSFASACGVRMLRAARAALARSLANARAFAQPRDLIGSNPPPRTDTRRAPSPGPCRILWSQRADSRPPAASACSGRLAPPSRARWRTLARSLSLATSSVRIRRPARKREGPRRRGPVVYYGANERIRTADPRITSALLYQLSHVGFDHASARGRMRLSIVRANPRRRKREFAVTGGTRWEGVGRERPGTAGARHRRRPSPQEESACPRPPSARSTPSTTSVAAAPPESATRSTSSCALSARPA